MLELGPPEEGEHLGRGREGRERVVGSGDYTEGV